MIKKSGQLLKAAPDIPTLHQLLAKCFQQPGEKLQVQWRSADNHLFILDVIYSLKERRPNWQLLSEKSGRRQIIADYSGHDILLVYKQITTAANNALDGRIGEDQSRLNRTRDARAAATDWLESKGSDSTGGTPAPRGGGGFWSDDSQHEFPRDEPQDSVIAALDDSPWNKSPTGAHQIQQPPQQSFQQSGQNMGPRPGQEQEQRPLGAPPPYQYWGQTAASADFNWAATVSPQQGGTAAPAPQGAPVPPGGAAPGQTQSPQNQSGPAPVKVNSPNPQATGPKPIQAPRAPVHPDKGAGVVDKGGSLPADRQPDKQPDRQAEKQAEKQAALKKLQHPDKAGGAATNSRLPAAKPPEKAPEKPPEKPVEKPPEKPDLAKLGIAMSGDLGAVSVTKLLKQLQPALFSGKIEFADESLAAMVILEDGKAIEAWFGELKGDFALLEILLWTAGNYTLTPGVIPNDRNVKSTPEVLVEHNKNIANLLEELAGEGLTATSTFKPSNAQLSSEEFDTLAKPDAPMELEKLARLYIKLDGKKTLAELNELQVLPRPALVQAIHHLYYNNIIDIIDPVASRKEVVVAPKEIDNGAIESVMTSLRRIDTGLFTYAAFLYFLQEEFFRIYRAKSSLSVLVFEMREISAADGLVRRVPLSTDAIADATMRISACKRHTDVVAHYEAHDFAILLPSTGAGGTKVFANKVIKVLTETPLMGTEGRKLSFAFGSASIPEDFREISMLLGGAEMAMNEARTKGKPLIQFKEVMEG